MTGDEIAAELRQTRREAKRTLEKHKVPMLVLTERTWLVDATEFRAFIDRLAQQSLTRVEQRELAADYLRPARSGTRRTAKKSRR